MSLSAFPPGRSGAIDRQGRPYDRSEPATYGTSVSPPPGYDAFWQETWERLARVPLDPRAVPVPLRSDPEVEVYEGHYTSWEGLRIACWYCVPRGPGIGEGGRHPAVAFMPGYVSEPPLGTGKDWARAGFACVVAAPRGKLRSNAVFNPGYPGLLTHNLADFQTYGYRGFYCDAWRTIDFLLSRPEVDAGRIGVTGSSQGGGLSIVTAAWRPEVRAACPGAPYLCGIRDALNLTQGHPYEEINEYLRTFPERREAVLRTLDFYDGINMAPRVRCPTLVNIGLVDPTCPPETGYAVFAALGAETKELRAYPGEGHSAGAVEHAPLVKAWMRRYLELPAAPAVAAAAPPAAPAGTPRLPRVPEPEGFDAYWGVLAAELDGTEVSPELELLPLRTSAEVHVYALRFTSIGPTRLFAYLAVPAEGQDGQDGPGRDGGVEVRLPGYASVVGPPVGGLERRWTGRRAVLQLCHRGQRLSDRPYAAAFPGLLTDGIASPETYVWRGIVADACRAVDAALALPPDLVAGPVEVTGNDLALFVAALRGRAVRAVRAAPALFYRLAETLPQTSAYPLEELNDHLRAYPEQAPAVATTLSYFDPVAAARRAGCPVTVGDGQALAPLRDALGERYRPAG